MNLPLQSGRDQKEDRSFLSLHYFHWVIGKKKFVHCFSLPFELGFWKAEVANVTLMLKERKREVGREGGREWRERFHNKPGAERHKCGTLIMEVKRNFSQIVLARACLALFKPLGLLWPSAPCALYLQTLMSGSHPNCALCRRQEPGTALMCA